MRFGSINLEESGELSNPNLQGVEPMRELYHKGFSNNVSDNFAHLSFADRNCLNRVAIHIW